MKLNKVLLSSLDKHPIITDSIIALVLVGLALVNLRTYWDLQSPQISPYLAVILTILAILPLIWRRRFPLAVFIIVLGMIILLQALNVPEMNFTLVASFVALFSAAAYGHKHRQLVCTFGVIIMIGGLTWETMISSAAFFSENIFLYQFYTIFWNSLLILGIWWFGNTFRISQDKTLQLLERSSQLEQRTEQLQQERDENARRAVFNERVRIARELHDVVAHHVSLMGIQAAAASQVLKQYPEKAMNSLNLIEKSGRQAVSELYRILGLLRDDKQVDELKSQPGLYQLNELVTDIKQAGLPVKVTISGEEREIPQTVDLSLYRIIEEALTNTLKHAGPAEVTVAITYQSNAIHLDIHDNGCGMLPDSISKGKGLIGMRERVNLLSGEFWAGNDSNSGFSVKVKIPLSY